MKLNISPTINVIFSNIPLFHILFNLAYFFYFPFFLCEHSVKYQHSPRGQGHYHGMLPFVLDKDGGSCQRFYTKSINLSFRNPCYNYACRPMYICVCVCVFFIFIFFRNCAHWTFFRTQKSSYKWNEVINQSSCRAVSLSIVFAMDVPAVLSLHFLQLVLCP